MNLLYYYSYSFADDFSPEIAARLAQREIGRFNMHNPHAVRPSFAKRVFRKLGLIERPKQRDPGILALGSIFQMASHQDVVWGTGVNPRWQAPLPSGAKIDIRAVRGPLTRDYIIDKLGHDCPEVYGDPGILFADLFPEFKREDSGEPLVLAQHNDEEIIAQNPDKYAGHPLFLGQREGKPWGEFVERICKASFVVSSSLHGLILAESYGVPCRWWHDPSLPSASTEGRFKFNDYYLSTGREIDQYAISLEEAFEMGPFECPNLTNLKDKLRAAFPQELI